MEAKKIKNRTELIIYILAVLGLVGVVNYLGTRWFKRIDMTEGKEYSISDATKKVLKGLDDIITVKVYFSKDLPPHIRKTVTDVNDVLSEYQAYGGKKLQISWEDPSTDEDAKEMARSLGIPEVQMQTIEKDKAQVVNGFLGIAILFEDKKETIPVVQNLQNLEYDLTMAIMKASRKTTPKVGVVKIDTVPPIPPQMRMQMQQNLPETTEDMFKNLYENLRMNYEVSTVDLSKGTPVDSTIKTLVVPGLDNITEQGAFEIDQYFMRGGNLIVLADAVKVDFQYGLNAKPLDSKVLEILEHYGVRVEKDMVLDASCGQVAVPQKYGPFQMNVPVPYPFFVRIGQDGFNSNNPAVSALSGAIFPWVHSLTFLVDTSENAVSDTDNGSVIATPLVHSSQKSWLISDQFNLNPQQKWAPPAESDLKQYTVAAHLTGKFSSFYKEKGAPSKAAENDTISQINLQPKTDDSDIIAETSNGHLVVFGDADFAGGQNATQENVMMLVNTVDWLTLDDNLISIRTRAIKDRTIETDLLKEGSSKPNIIRLVNIVVMPLLAIIFGLVIFLKRREPVTVTPATKTEDKSK